LRLNPFGSKLGRLAALIEAAPSSLGEQSGFGVRFVEEGDGSRLVSE
jgi:hypothetical protein